MSNHTDYARWCFSKSKRELNREYDHIMSMKRAAEHIRFWIDVGMSEKAQESLQEQDVKLEEYNTLLQIIRLVKEKK